MLAFTAALWWIARRDLAARALSPGPESSPAPDTAELEQLCATLETLVTRLDRRLDAVERHQAAASLPAASQPTLQPTPEPAPLPKADQRHGALDALLAAGVTDPTEIARQTGLGRGEVDLILSLRRRQL